MSARGLEWIVAGALAVAVVASGVWVVQVKHESRQRFAELEELKREADRLQVEWGRLRLEQGTLATHARIEALARDELELVEPAQTQVIVLAEPSR